MRLMALPEARTEGDRAPALLRGRRFRDVEVPGHAQDGLSGVIHLGQGVTRG